MLLSDRSTAMFFSSQLEETRGEAEGDRGERGGEAEGRGEGRGEVGKGDSGKGIAEFRSKVERLFVKSKLAGPGPWEELASKLQITQAERDLMATFESASLSERLNIFRKVIL